MRRLIIIGISFLTFSLSINAQEFSILDTILLNEVVHYGDLKKYQSGVKTEKIDPLKIRLVQEGGIDNLLMRFSTIYIKSDAGGLSTIRFRGTSPNHTSINFGGINLNSLTLGHSNLSNIPSFLFDELTLQYGSSSAVNGSGAIGGAISLTLSESWTNGLKVNVKSTFGSFGEYFNGAKIFAGNKKWESVTRLYLFLKKNNFPFKNTYTDDIDNPVIRDIQKGASIKNMGILQEINYRFHEKEFIRSSIWVENSWHQVQPNMQTNYRFTSTEELDDDNIRIWAEYNNNKHAVKLRGGLGFVHDMEVNDNITTEKIGTNRLVSELHVAHDFSAKVGVKSGVKYKYIKPEVYAYADSVIKYEEHFDLFLSSFFKISPNFRATLNLRQMFVTNFKAPFTPSLGTEYIIRLGNFSYFKITSALAKSYRIPTFNDRYWGTQGNPNLKPESGKSIELGGTLISEKENNLLKVGVNAFYMDVEDWIEWRNFGVWMAENVSEVVSKGIEFQSLFSFKLGHGSSDIILNYTWNKVEAVSDISENAVLNRQLIYTPKHMGNSSFSLKLDKWEFLFDGQFTGSRYADSFGNKLKSYVLVNSGATYKLDFNKHRFRVTLSTNNVFNADYVNEKYYAMPGRSFRISVNYEFEIIK